MAGSLLSPVKRFANLTAPHALLLARPDLLCSRRSSSAGHLMGAVSSPIPAPRTIPNRHDPVENGLNPSRSLALKRLSFRCGTRTVDASP